MDETIKTNNKNKNNVDLFATFKINNQNFLEEQSSEIIGSSSIKANKSKTSSLSKKSLINKINNSYIHNNKSDINIYNNREIEFIMDKGNNKKINKNNLNIKRHSYFNNNHKIYKNHKKRYYNDKNNNQLINQMLGINIPNTNILANNIITTSANINEHRDNFNSAEKIQ